MAIPKLSFTSLSLVILLSFCSSKRTPPAEKNKVFIDYKSGKFTLYRNGRPFFIKGGSGFTQLSALHESGGNTIRVWDTADLGRILDEAEANKLAVIVG